MAAKRKKMTQAEVVRYLAEKTDTTPKFVKTFFSELSSLIVAECNPKSRVAPGVCAIPGIANVKGVKKPARKARKGRNPFTGEEMMFKAKPASTAIRIRPVKKLKDQL